MPKYPVDYSGEWNDEYYSGESVLELTDEQLKILVDLIKENDGETDIEKLELEEKYPEIYEAFHDAFLQPVAFDGSVQWAVDVYMDGYFDGPSDEEIIAVMESEGIFSFEYEEDDYLDEEGELDEERLIEDKCEAWRAFFEELSYEKKYELLDRFFGDQIYKYDTLELTGNMYIPGEIIEMAENNH